MLKSFHILLIFSSLIAFVGRVALLEIRPQLLQVKLIKILPHVINTLLLVSGVSLVFSGGWLEGEYGWIISKLFLLFVYVGFGVMCLHSQGVKRWGAFIGAIACFIAIFVIAITKHGFV